MVKEAMTQRIWMYIDILGIAGIVFLVTVQMASITERAEDWMIVNKVYVPDFYVGEDPEIIYDRTVVKAFFGRWNVKIYDAETTIPVCSSQGTNLYEPIDYPVGVTLSWYLGKQCNLKPGRYLMRSIWVVGDGLMARNTSNIFEVRPDIILGPLMEGSDR